MRVLVATAVSIGALAGAGSAAAAPRYAAPGGGGTACSAVAPCAVDEAVNNAADGDEVIVAPGDYGSPATPLSTTLGIFDKNIDVHGIAGQPRPRLFFASDGAVSGLAVNTVATTVRYLTIEQSGTATALELDGGTVEQVDARASGGGACAVASVFARTPLLRDAACATTAAGAAAIDVDQGGGGAPIRFALRNVTGYATGPASDGLRVRSSLGTLQLTVDVFDSILHGAAADVAAQSDATTTSATADLVRSNYATERETGPGPAAVTDPGTAGNQTSQPLLADAPTGDFHELPGSPTVDAGADDPANGALDLDGEARTLGAATDIGADELVPAPAAATSAPAAAAAAQAAPPAAGPVPDRVRPVATSLRLRPAALRTHTTISYRLTEAATVRFTVVRVATGRQVGSFTRRGKRGANSFRFGGTLRGHRLRAGLYRMRAVPTDAAGNRGAAIARRFRIVRAG